MFDAKALARAPLVAAAASPTQKRVAAAAALTSLLVFILLAFVARVRGPPAPAFIAGYEAALWIVDIVTAALLFGQFARVKTRALLLVAGGYLFDAFLIVPHALTFPGLFAPDGLLGGGPQTDRKSVV